MSEKLQQHVKKSILDFSSDGGLNVYEFEGVDYSEDKKNEDRKAWAAMGRPGAGQGFLEERRTLLLPGLAAIDEERENKRKHRMLKLVSRAEGAATTVQTHCVLQQAAHPSRSAPPIPRGLKLPPMHEWQFFNRARLIELHEIEMKAANAAAAQVRRAQACLSDCRTRAGPCCSAHHPRPTAALRPRGRPGRPLCFRRS